TVENNSVNSTKQETANTLMSLLQGSYKFFETANTLINLLQSSYKLPETSSTEVQNSVSKSSRSSEPTQTQELEEKSQKYT
ncbi:15644_t:CDS:2, partial [Dentiscutata heterogama]